MSRQRLISEWGAEVLLRCECRDIKSHYMNGKEPYCPICKKQTKMLFGESWEDIADRYKRG